MIIDILDVNEKINGHSITYEWLLRSLRENDKVYQKLYGNRTVKEIKAKDISDGKGFASEILRCTITFSDTTNPNEFYTTILKIPNFKSMKKAHVNGGGNDAFFEDLVVNKFAEIHNDECDFYAQFAPILDIPIPRVFKFMKKIPGVQEGCLHMEDLSTIGITMSSVFHDINLTKVKNMIKVLARMHKNVLEMDEQTWRGKYLKNAELTGNIIDVLKPMNEKFLKNCKNEARLRPLVEKYSKLGESKAFIRYVCTQSHKDLNLVPVIVHGDMHSANLMWAIDSEGNVQNDLAAIVDWQTIFEGSPMADLAKFLIKCASGVVRRQAETFAINFYLDCLAFEFEGDASKVPYTADQLQRSYDLLFMSQVFTIMGGTMFIMEANEHKIENQNLKDAYMDAAELRAIHGYEDLDRLLSGEYKEYMDLYGK